MIILNQPDVDAFLNASDVSSAFGDASTGSKPCARSVDMTPANGNLVHSVCKPGGA